MSHKPIHRNPDIRAPLSAPTPDAAQGNPRGTRSGASIVGVVNDSFRLARKAVAPGYHGTLSQRVATSQLKTFGTPAQILFDSLERTTAAEQQIEELEKATENKTAGLDQLATQASEHADSPATPADENWSSGSATPIDAVSTQSTWNDIFTAVSELKKTLLAQPAADARSQRALGQHADSVDGDGHGLGNIDGDRTPTGPRRQGGAVPLQAGQALGVPTAQELLNIAFNRQFGKRPPTATDPVFTAISQLASIDRPLIKDCQFKVRSMSTSDAESLKLMSAMAAGLSMTMQRSSDPSQRKDILHLTQWLDKKVSKNLAHIGDGEAITAILADLHFARRCGNRALHLDPAIDGPNLDDKIDEALGRLMDEGAIVPADVGRQLAELLVQTVKPAIRGDAIRSRVPDLAETVGSILEKTDDLDDQSLADALMGLQFIFTSPLQIDPAVQTQIRAIFTSMARDLPPESQATLTARLSAMNARGGVGFEDETLHAPQTR